MTLIFPNNTMNEPFTNSNIPEEGVFRLSSINEWDSDGKEICTAVYNQTNPQICYDGAGGAIIIWEDLRNPVTQKDIYAQKIDSNGNKLWDNNGEAVCTSITSQINPQICSDGNGGAIITWQDFRSATDFDIYTQSIDSNGNIKWNINCIPICTSENNQYAPQICIDGVGGAIITWYDNRSGDFDIYAQRIDIDGNIKWNPNGTLICTEINDQSLPQICSDENGGAIITWQDYRNGVPAFADIYSQKINSTGEVKWTINGEAICTENGVQANAQLCSDKTGGAIITWQDFRNFADYDIYVQRVNSTGSVKWVIEGLTICAASDDQENPKLCTDGIGGAIITWEDYRDGIDYDLYAQMANSNGNITWIPNGVVICTIANDQTNPQICSDGGGGAIITWQDYRSAINYDIYSQRVNTNGNMTWTENGAPICTSNNDQKNPQICVDGTGGAIISWQDYRYGSDYDIFAQNIKNEAPFSIWDFLIEYGLYIGIGIALLALITAIALRRKSIKGRRLRVFISHAVADFEVYKIKEIAEYLEKQKEISDVYYCEEDLVGNIDDWMKRTVPRCQLLIFFSSDNSLKSRDCMNELKLARKYNIQITPILGTNLRWEDLEGLNINRELGMVYDPAEFDKFRKDLNNYVLKFKEDLEKEILEKKEGRKEKKMKT